MPENHEDAKDAMEDAKKIDRKTDVQKAPRECRFRWQTNACRLSCLPWSPSRLRGSLLLFGFCLTGYVRRMLAADCRSVVTSSDLLKDVRMRFMLLCYDDERAWQSAGEAALREAMQEAVALTHELDAQGQYLLAAPLHSPSTATSVRVRNGQPLITDGPFAETNEVLGGFYLIDVDSLDEAVRIAGRHPGARVGTVEVRRVMELDGLPDRRPVTA
jgi:hypothetical protein